MQTIVNQLFSVNYNEKYLLCINNGNYFTDYDMSAIINVAGNYKDGEDIGSSASGLKYYTDYLVRTMEKKP